ncbi:MAG: hypothetical protein M3314_07875, partial [Actinomycetota bacterium]|nr:hypothetical protein [Actinomycetota bacterium]
NFLPTCSVVLRHGLVRELPDWFTEVWIADYTLHVLHAQHGNLRLLPGLMGAYRVHSGGVFSAKSTDQRTQEMLKILNHLDAELGFRYHHLITSSTNWLQAVESLRAGDFRRARRFARQRATGRPLSGHSLRALFLVSSPRLYRSVARSIT